MRFGIRGKFVGILLVATVVPLAVAVIAINIFGNKYYRSSAGDGFEKRAEQMANYLVLSVDAYSRSLYNRLAISDLHEILTEINAHAPGGASGDTGDLHERWAELPEESPEVQRVLNNRIARALREFQELSPLFSEIFVTDELGRVVAATNKPSTYRNRDEFW